MSRIYIVAIVKGFMLKVAPLIKVSDFTTLKSCSKWLEELTGGTCWVDKMRAIKEARLHFPVLDRIFFAKFSNPE